MTTSSLLHHDNLTVGIYDPPLAKFLKSPTSSTFDFSLGRIHLLPNSTALSDLQAQIKKAHTSIFIAMFTLTHPVLLQALYEAHLRGVEVTVAIDHYTARGASQKAVALLQRQGIKVVFSQGMQLFHHKWAYIDRSQLILGSTNWTRAAFTKNQDCLLCLYPLSTDHQKLLDDLCSTILLESNDTL